MIINFSKKEMIKVKCDMRFCDKTAIEYDENEELYLCSEHVEFRNVYVRKGKMGTIKHYLKTNLGKLKQELKDEWK